MIRLFRNILATIGGGFLVLIIVAILWWNFAFYATDSGGTTFASDIIVNPTRTHVAHHELSAKDVILYQREEYVAFLGDGGGCVVAKLHEPLDYSSEVWFPMAQISAEYLSFITSNSKDSKHVAKVINAPNAIWCVRNLTRSGQHISNIVVAVYDPDTRIIFEYILHT